MEYGAKNKIWDKVITLKAIQMGSQPIISTISNALCEIHKCGLGLQINEKEWKL